MADGHFTNSGSLIVELAQKDLYHLECLAAFLSSSSLKKRKNSCRLSIRNKRIILFVCKKFEIVNNKTYNPPSLSVFEKMTDNQFVSFFAGFIDGDGCIFTPSRHTTPNLTVKNHISWIDQLSYFKNRTYKILNLKPIKSKNLDGRKNNAGYAVINISDAEVLSKLKGIINQLNLPIMSRNWDKVPNGYVSRYRPRKNNK